MTRIQMCSQVSNLNKHRGRTIVNIRMILIYMIMKRQICLELESRFVNYLQAWDGTSVWLNNKEISLVVQRFTKLALRMANMSNGLMKN